MEIVYDREQIIEVREALCPKGREYAFNEIFQPLRTLTTTVKVKGGELPLVGVRTDRPIPREKLREGVRILSKLELEAPVYFHQVILENFLTTGTKVIATREIRKVIF